MTHLAWFRTMLRPIPMVAVTLTAPMVSAPGLAQVLPQLQEQQTPSTSSPSVLNAADQAAYVLGPGDVVTLDLFGQPDVFRVGSNSVAFRVLNDGSISLPLIGSVFVSGLTLRQAEQDIASRYRRFYKRPYITMVLTQSRQVTLAIVGEVRRPGTYPITDSNIPTVTQLIALAQGTTQSADLTQVQVRRPQLNGSNEVITLNLLKLLKEGDLNQNLNLRDQDTVFIPVSNQLDITNSALVADSTLASDNTQPISIAVIGEVYRPGPYTLRAGSAQIGEAGSSGQTNASSTDLPTVSQAIQIAGGIKPEANIRSVQVLRRSRTTGEVQTLEVNLWELLKTGDLNQDIALQQGDTINVLKAEELATAEQVELATTTFSPATIEINVVGQVRNAGVVRIQPNTPLSTGLLAAGGFIDERANKSSVKLIRLNPDGTVTERKIKVDFTQAINEETNPALRNNDVIVVDRSGLTKATDTLSSIFAPITSTFGFVRLFTLFYP